MLVNTVNKGRARCNANSKLFSRLQSYQMPRSGLCKSLFNIFLRRYYLATTEEESAVQHLFRVSVQGTDRRPKCLTCGIVRETDRNRCLYNTAKFSTDHSHYLLTCAGPGVPDIAIYDRVSGRCCTPCLTRLAIGEYRRLFRLMSG